MAPGTGTASRRASDGDRDQAIAILNNAVAIGELKPDEHEQRLQQALDATTLEALHQLTTDLTPPSSRTPWWSNRRLLSGGIGAALVVGLIIAAVNGPGPQRQPTQDTQGSNGVPTSSSTTSPASTSTFPSAAGVRPSPASAPVNGISIQVVPPGEFAQEDPADQCGFFGAEYTGGGANCYLVVQFNNTTSSTVSFTPVDLHMVDQTGDRYTVEPVAPPCYDTVDVHATATLGAQHHVLVQLCFPVMTGALPASLEGTGSLSGLNLTVPSDTYVGTWGGA